MFAFICISTESNKYESSAFAEVHKSEKGKWEIGKARGKTAMAIGWEGGAGIAENFKLNSNWKTFLFCHIPRAYRWPPSCPANERVTCCPRPNDLQVINRCSPDSGGIAPLRKHSIPGKDIILFKGIPHWEATQLHFYAGKWRQMGWVVFCLEVSLC